MKVLHICTADREGGAARAAYRIHRALVDYGVDSRMAVMRKVTDDWRVFGPATPLLRTVAKIWPNLVNVANRLRHGEAGRLLDCASAHGFFRRLNIPFQPDIYHLHLLTDGMMSVSEIARLPQPVVWTHHDEWGLTGGCHYDGGCEAYQKGCGRCPLGRSRKAHDLSWRLFRQKQRVWAHKAIQPVAPCRWMQEKIDASPVWSRQHAQLIPNPIDLAAFRPIAKRTARQLLGLKENGRYVLFGALGAVEMGGRKGGDLLVEALRLLVRGGRCQDVELLMIGQSAPECALEIGCPVHYRGHLTDDLALALHYAAADLFVAPSREDNLPNTVIESLACDTPVVAFRIGGMPDLITHQETGWLAAPYQIADLAQGIEWILERGAQLSGRMRRHAERHYHPTRIAEAYAHVYARLVSASG
jgi:glycosyltransferase involved in cell wall biosynthesis